MLHTNMCNKCPVAAFRKGKATSGRVSGVQKQSSEAL